MARSHVELRYVRQEGARVVDGRAAEDDASAAIGRLVQLGDVPRLLVRGAAHHEHDGTGNFVRSPVLGRSQAAALDVRVAGLFQAALEHLLRDIRQVRLVLRVHVLDTLEVVGEGGLGHLEEGLVLEQVPCPGVGAPVPKELVHKAQLVVADALAAQVVLQLRDRAVVLVAQRIEQDQPQSLHVSDGRASQHLRHGLKVLLAVLRAGQLLLQLRRLQEAVRLDDARELMHHGDVLGHVARHAPELGISVDESLHLLDGLDARSVLGLRLVVLHILFDAKTEVTEVCQGIVPEELVLCCGHHDGLKLRPNVRDLRHINAVVLQREQLVQHGLVCPLVQQGCHWVISSVHKQQHRRGLALLFTLYLLKEALLLLDTELQSLGHLPRQIRRGSVADRRQHPECEAD
mmetsp:Transcript_33530/g.85769  ORF Transcript_33530/g.85769 Transcript_33530/m.85769 type:complete len:403 (-) Transcript_33530:506-1714(-)